MTVSDYLARVLADEGIGCAFEVTGGMITILLDSIATYGKTQLISVHHEQAAAFGAEAHGRITGRPGVAFATSGPGATNLLTGIGSCYFDSSPAVFITGQVNTHEQRGDRAIRQLGFQETDIVAMAAPIVKRAFRVARAEDVPAVLRDAFALAVEGRPGPVLVDIPMDVQRRDVEPAAPPKMPRVRTHVDVTAVAAALRNAERPLILAGGGLRSSRTVERFRAVVAAAGVPVVHSLMAVDALPHAEPLRVGMIGSYGNRWANHVMHDADVVLVLGSRLDIRQTGSDTASFKGDKSVFHVDVEPGEINNRLAGCEPVVADLNDFLLSFPLERLHAADSAWSRHIAELRARWPADAENDPELPLNPNRTVRLLSHAARRGAGWSVDVGQHQMWAAQSVELEPHQRFLTSGGMGSMGFALPAAVGWAAATQGALPVWVLAGDGGFQLNVQELQTVRRNGWPIKIVVFDNGAHGMVRQFQETYLDARYQSTVWGYSAPDFVRVAQAYDIPARRIATDVEVDGGAAWLAAQDGPALLCVAVEMRANAYPKLAFGRPITEMEPLAKPTLMEST